MVSGRFVSSFGWAPAQRFTLEFDLFGLGEQAVTDGIGDRRIPQDFMPCRQWSLGNHHGGSSTPAILKDLKQGQPVWAVELVQAEVIKDEQVGLGYGLDLFIIAVPASALPELGPELCAVEVQRRHPELASPSAQGAGKVAFTGASGAGDQKVLTLTYPSAGGQPFEKVLVEVPVDAGHH